MGPTWWRCLELSNTVDTSSLLGLKITIKNIKLGSGCGSVGRVVASDTRGPQFESSHRQKIIYILNICLLSIVYWKDDNKEKEAGNGPFFKKIGQN